MEQALSDFNEEWRSGDRAKARTMAEEYVAANREALDATIRDAVREYREAHLDDPVTLEDMVRLVSAYRAQGDETSRTLVDMALLAKFEPQVITGMAAFTPPLDVIRKAAG